MYFKILLVCALISYIRSNPSVQLPTGKIIGRIAHTFAGNSYFSFQKIPYAVPPIGNLRFKPPQPVRQWNGTLNGTTLDVVCYQLGRPAPVKESEDCLFLNVYAPKRGRQLPVMFYIHGGGFTFGSSFSVKPDLFIDRHVILVSINYRLGPFGFLSTEDEIIPGNDGLRDQQLALKWTHDNIGLFGGDPAKITVFGQSAGASSVSYQLLYPSSQRLLRGVILQSGTFLVPRAIQRNAKAIAFGTGAQLDPKFANSTDSKALLDFLQNVEAKDLKMAAEKYTSEVAQLWDDNVSQGKRYSPVIEVEHPNAFITQKMFARLKSGQILKVPTMIGINSEESLTFNKDPEVLQKVLEAWDKNLELIVPVDMQIVDPQQKQEMAKEIRDIYTEGKPFGTDLGSGIKYSSDNMFIRGIIKYAELFSSLSDTFFYQFSYNGAAANSTVFYSGTYKVGHSEELSYMFCSEEECNYDDSDKIVSSRLLTLWTNFAKYLNPTPRPLGLLHNITWPKVDENFSYLNISDTLEIRDHPKEITISKWENLYKRLGSIEFDTY